MDAPGKPVTTLPLNEALYQRQLELLERCVERARASADSIERRATHEIERSDNATLLTVAGAFAFFTEMTDSCLLLLRARRLPAVFALLRVPLLGLADLHNLNSDPRYPLHMDDRRISEWVRLLEGAQRRPNPLLSDMAAEYDLAEETASMRATGLETREAGGQGMSDGDRLRQAGFEHEHGSVYWLWSLYAHANFGAIAAMHVTHDARFTFRPKDDLRELVTAADGLIGMALGAMYAVFPEFGLQTDAVDELRTELSAVRTAMGLHDGPRDAAAE